MYRIAVAGLSLHDTDVAGLECAKRGLPNDLGLAARELADDLGASELVLVSTCNRIEIVYAREEGHLPSRADLELLFGALKLDERGRALAFHYHCGIDAARHLFRVVSSLDSLVLGEDQILVQVREAHRAAEMQGLVGRLLEPLFQTAFHIGKDVRTRTEISSRPISVTSLALERLHARFDGSQPSIAIVGAGEMSSLAARGARELGFNVRFVVNRSRERGEKLANEVGAQWVDLTALAHGELPIDALVSATSRQGFVAESQALARMAANAPLGRGLLAIDLAVPRDLAACDDARVELVDLDALRAEADRNRQLRLAAAREAEKMVETQLETFTRRDVGKRAADALAELSGTTREIFERELSTLFVGPLADLDADRRRAIERWARVAFGRIEHAPITTIKRLVTELGARTEDAR